jgi:hypothetical protein
MPAAQALDANDGGLDQSSRLLAHALKLGFRSTACSSAPALASALGLRSMFRAGRLVRCLSVARCLSLARCLSVGSWLSVPGFEGLGQVVIGQDFQALRRDRIVRETGGRDAGLGLSAKMRCIRHLASLRVRTPRSRRHMSRRHTMNSLVHTLFRNGTRKVPIPIATPRLRLTRKASSAEVHWMLQIRALARQAGAGAPPAFGAWAI